SNPAVLRADVTTAKTIGSSSRTRTAFRPLSDRRALARSVFIFPASEKSARAQTLITHILRQCKAADDRYPHLRIYPLPFIHRPLPSLLAYANFQNSRLPEVYNF